MSRGLRGTGRVVGAVLLLFALLILISHSAAAVKPACSAHPFWYCRLHALVPLNSSFEVRPTIRQSTVTARQHSFTTTSTSTSAGDMLRFRLMTDSAPFPGRSSGQMHCPNRSITFTNADTLRRTTFVNPLVMFGGRVYGQTVVGFGNDVWASSDAGKSWHIVAGETTNGHTAAGNAAQTSFKYKFDPGATSTLGPINQHLYLMGGYYGGEVWMSSDGGVSWRNQTANARPPHVAGAFAAVVANSMGHVIIAAGGQEIITPQGFYDIAYGNAVWMSMNNGRNWRQQNKAAPFAARLGQVAFNVPNPLGSPTNQWDQPTGATDFMYVIGGSAAHDNLNDVWATSDEGVTWAAISPAARFPQREVGSGVASRNGLLIVAAGYADEIAGDFDYGPDAIKNDVWVSANGGYSWGRCVLNAEWSDRVLPMVALDSQGHLIVGSGENYDSDTNSLTIYNDVWRSTISFNDLNDVAAACGVEIPACGVGLRCWPGNGTVVATDGSFVACAACPRSMYATTTTAAETSSGNVETIVMVVFIVLSVVLLGAVVWLHRKAQAAGVLSGAVVGAAGSTMESLVGGTGTK